MGSESWVFDACQSGQLEYCWYRDVSCMPAIKVDYDYEFDIDLCAPNVVSSHLSNFLALSALRFISTFDRI